VHCDAAGLLFAVCVFGSLLLFISFHLNLFFIVRAREIHDSSNLKNWFRNSSQFNEAQSDEWQTFVAAPSSVTDQIDED